MSEQATPLVKQFFAIKEQYSEALLLFQVGDFFEFLFDDAKVASSVLHITLTKRGRYNGEPIPLCGVPVHTAEQYYIKLAQAGYKVVICKQAEAAKPGKLVLREVTDVITPATITSDVGIDADKTVVLSFISSNESTVFILSVEFITQQAKITSFALSQIAHILAELQRINPTEVIISSDLQKDIKEAIVQEGWQCSQSLQVASFEKADKWMSENHINQNYHKPTELFLGYFEKYHPHTLEYYNQFREYTASHIMFLDVSTQKHLELLQNTFDGSKQFSLYSLLNHCKSSMGSRLLKRWITHPLKAIDTIVNRHEAVHFLYLQWAKSIELQKHISEVGDLERICGRIRLGRAQYGDYQRLSSSLQALKKIILWFIQSEKKPSLLDSIHSRLHSYDKLLKKLNEELFDHDRPSDEHFIRPESDDILTELNTYVTSSTQVIIAFERAEQERTGVPNLKVRHTPLYGYVIEVTKTHLSKVPEAYVRVQTLSNKERFSLSELKSLENELIGAQEKYKNRDKELYQELHDVVVSEIYHLTKTARALAELDVLLSFAYVARTNRYTCPVMHKEKKMIIKQGKHPVLSQTLGSSYISNSLHFDEKEYTWVITGPNMGGKSTFMRQTALICLMAQIGSWIPAEYAELPVLDAIFTRIGATDYVSKGKSTFFVEMEEASLICAHATDKSLIILDEIGRGTSTYDGMSIACALLEYIHNQVGSFTLFATHYHELHKHCSIKNGLGWYHSATKRLSSGLLLLLYAIQKGHTTDSMGIDVAQKVGLPQELIKRALTVKKQLEN